MIIGTGTVNACPWSNVTFECTVNGDNGATVWQGSVFDRNCNLPEIALDNVHIRFGGILPEKNCNKGAIRLTNWSMNMTDINQTVYTSQLTVILKPEMNETCVECFHDNGITATPVGSRKLNISTCMSHSVHLFVNTTMGNSNGT